MTEHATPAHHWSFGPPEKLFSAQTIIYFFLCIEYKIVITVGFEYLFETQFELMQQFNWGSDHSLSWFPWPAMYPKSTLSLYRLTDFLRGNVKSWLLKKCLVTRAVWTLYTLQPGCWNVVVNWLIKKVNFVWTPHLTTPLAASSFTRSPRSSPQNTVTATATRGMETAHWDWPTYYSL